MIQIDKQINNNNFILKYLCFMISSGEFSICLWERQISSPFSLQGATKSGMPKKCHFLQFYFLSCVKAHSYNLKKEEGDRCVTALPAYLPTSRLFFFFFFLRRVEGIGWRQRKGKEKEKGRRDTLTLSLFSTSS